MKKLVTNIMVTTFISLLVLTIVLYLLHGLTEINYYNFYTTLGINIVIHLGLLLTYKFESKHFILEALLDITFIIVVLITWGAIFDWMPALVLAVMGVVIYLIGLFLSIARVRDEIDDINKALKRRNRTKKEEKTP